MRRVWTVLFVFVFVSLLSSVCCRTPPPRPEDGCSSMSVRLRTFRLMTSGCNWTTLKEEQLQQVQAPTTTLYLPLLYLLAFAVGLPANLLALWVLVVRTPALPSTTLLINLTLADCLLLAVLPFRVAYHLRGNHWVLGEPFCRLVTAVFYGNMYGSVWCLALVALDRYVALVHPFAARTLRSRRVSLYLTAGVWLAVLAAMLPLLASRQTYRLDELQITTCHDALPQEEQQTFFLPYFACLFAGGFVAPLGAVLYCHGAVLRTLLAQGRRYGHAVRLTLLVLLVFIVCLLPSNVLLLLTYADGLVGGAGEDLYVPYMVSLALSTFNSCLDPFIFYYVSEEFRIKARDALRCRRDPEDTQGSTPPNLSSCPSHRSKVTLLSMSGQRPGSGTPDASA